MDHARPPLASSRVAEIHVGLGPGESLGSQEEPGHVCAEEKQVKKAPTASKKGKKGELEVPSLLVSLCLVPSTPCQRDSPTDLYSDSVRPLASCYLLPQSQFPPSLPSVLLRPPPQSATSSPILTCSPSPLNSEY